MKGLYSVVGQNSNLIGELFADQQERLLRYASSLTHDMARAEDLVQDAFVQALAHAETIRTLNRYQRSAWLSRTVKNRFIDQQRAFRRAVFTDLREAEQAEVVEAFTLRVEYLQIIDQIPERYRELLEMRYLQERTSVEIGKLLGVPAATVRSRLRLAHHWMRENRNKLE